MKSEDTKKKYQFQKGFTLVEMMVAVLLFSLIIGVISGLFISGLRGQRNALASQRLLDQTSYALEYMSRAMRMAIKQGKQVGPGCASFIDGVNYEITHGGQGLMFINHLEEDDCQEFFLGGVDGKQLIQSKKNGTETFPLTSEKLQIESLKFSLSGEYQGDDLQPKVTIFLEIKGAGQRIEEQPLMKIQTTISQRNLDITY